MPITLSVSYTHLDVYKRQDNMFPSKIKGKNSWDYALDHTLYKPRDILQFLKYCQNAYPDNSRLSLSETQTVLKEYSNQYFIEEMKNELAGFVEDEIIVSIPSIFRRLGGRKFDLSEFNKLSSEQCPGKEITIDDTKMLMMYLFEAEMCIRDRSRSQKILSKRGVRR